MKTDNTINYYDRALELTRHHNFIEGHVDMFDVLAASKPYRAARADIDSDRVLTAKNKLA